MSTQLNFTETLRYDEDAAGIKLYTTLHYQGQTERIKALVDTGASVCLFANEVGRRLGIVVEQGLPHTLDSLGGPVESFGHEVVLQTGELVFQSMVYFAKYPGLPRNFLGRRGWLRNLKLAIVDYDNLLYLGAYET